MDFQKTFNKYSNKIAINLGRPNKIPSKSTYQNFIIIPCYNEYDYIFKTLDSINQQKLKLLNQTLVVIVINNSNIEAENIVKNNKRTYEFLLKKKYKYEFVAIDCFSKKYSINHKKAGVGYARKIGFDYSLRYIKNKFSLLCSLDADTIIDKDYLYIVNKAMSINTNVCVVNFQHQKSSDPIIEKAIRKYEKQIKHIAKKIDRAGSPYGYVSMGSTIICNVFSYVACGGMSTKKATEDFYFLQSLAKFTEVKKIKNKLVFPSSRSEQRVYLGTGYRIKEFQACGEFKNLFFSEESFQILKHMLNILEKSYNKSFDLVLNAIDKKARFFLESKNLQKIWPQINLNAKDRYQFKLFIHQWFDALMIMQFLKKIN